MLDSLKCIEVEKRTLSSTSTQKQSMIQGSIFFSSPEPLGSQGELIVYPSSRRPYVRRRRPSVRPPFSKIFFSETARPIKTKFYVEPPWEGGTKVCINGPGHMTKMAATPIYGKTFKYLLQN